MVCLSSIRLRYSEPDLHRPWKMPLFPWIAILASAIQVSLIAVMVWDDPLTGFWSALAAFAPVLIYWTFGKSWRRQAGTL
jgi:amino acid transporter